MSAHVVGDKELVAKLDRLKKTQAKSAIRKGCRAGSKAVQEKAKDLAPQRTGALARAIKVRSLPRSRKWTGTTIKLDIRYGSFVEFGLRKRKMEAAHFLERAATEAGQEAVDTALDTIKAVIEAI